MSDLVLRPYQQRCVEAVREFFRKGFKRVLISAPTGCGKTIVLVFIAFMALGKSNKCLIIVNTDELVRQTVDKLRSVGVEPGVVKRERNEWDQQIVVASIQTLSREKRLNQFPPGYFKLVIIDECHFSLAPSYQRVMDYMRDSYTVGFSATLFRGDRKSLAKAGWEAVAFVYGIGEAIQEGYLVPPVAYRIEVQGSSLDGVRTKKNAVGQVDFSEADLASAINTVTRNATIVDAWLKRCEGRRTVAFCVSVQHAFDLANLFRKQGVDARVIHGNMPLGERRELLAAHQRGEFPVLCNCAVLTHGYDDPSISAVLMTRPTKSKTLFVQCVGRGLRLCPWENKVDCIILDFVDVSTKHKLVTTDEVVQLQHDMKYGVQDSVEVGDLRKGDGSGEGGPQGKTYENDDDAEKWRAKQADLLEKHKQRQLALQTELVSDKQLRFLFAMLTKDCGWPEKNAKVACFGDHGRMLSKFEMRKFIGRAKHGIVKPEDFA